jgi:hypothetical protein
MPMKDGKPIPYQKGGAKEFKYADQKARNADIDFILDKGPDKSIEGTLLGLSDSELRAAYTKVRNASQNKAVGRRDGGMMDELGYMGGGVSYSDRGPIKYSKGGAVSGKNFKGSF